MRRLLVALIAAALAAPASQTLAQTVPATAPSPLPEIGRVRSKGFCTTVRDNVAPSLLGVMKTDDLIGAGHRALAKMADDATNSSSQGVDLDRVYLDKVATSMAHNLRVVDALLADKKRFPDKATTDDDRFAQEVRVQLAAVAAEQHRTLDVLEGTLETDRMGQMRADIDTGMASSVSNQQGQPPLTNDVRTSFLDSAGLPDMAPVPVLSERSRLTTGKAPGQRPFDRVKAVIEQQQARIAHAETIAAPTITAAAYACHDDRPASSPAP
jgi:hypothetical protein